MACTASAEIGVVPLLSSDGVFQKGKSAQDSQCIHRYIQEHAHDYVRWMKSQNSCHFLMEGLSGKEDPLNVLCSVLHKNL